MTLTLNSQQLVVEANLAPVLWWSFCLTTVVLLFLFIFLTVAAQNNTSLIELLKGRK